MKSKKNKKKPCPRDLDEMCQDLKEWFEEFETWGKKARIDIVRLEGRAGFAGGDPGDPPEGPWD